jgi:hypothetical protein
MNLQVAECGGIDWSELAQDRDRCWRVLVNAAMNLRILYNVGNLTS